MAQALAQSLLWHIVELADLVNTEQVDTGILLQLQQVLHSACNL